MFRLYKCKETLDSYANADKKYEPHIQDSLFSHHESLIAADPKKREIIHKITRVKRFDGQEFLVYASTVEGRDSVYNRLHKFYRDNLGKYIELEIDKINTIDEAFVNNPNMDADFDIDGNLKTSGKSAFKTVIQVLGEHEAYSIPFSAKNLEKLKEKCKDKTSASVAKIEDTTSYFVSRENGITISVTDYESLRDGLFEELFTYGKKSPTKEERQRIDAMASRLSQTTKDEKQLPIMEVVA